ncbi:dephospho-CoA kinase [Rhodopirellula bahusiensis]|uniref:Dephospho-CoA kinase n=1 Tax=Rhodopirellula bahusiensis TaxID=2014065 RepID=A0A2G1W475_9BACT|nr:dephospho-CoA kinase [Rhodopirellula bahusiensis]PHQ33650.1 dephospho-CoA kinase [Rhodopirellula bahusiensis]
MSEGSINDSQPASSTPIIGIIGPPCSGKSTVARHLESLGGVWLNADEIAKSQLDEPDVIAELKSLLGDSIQLSDGSLSRSRLADLVFGEDENSLARLRQLESVLHPRTRKILEARIADAKSDQQPFVILDVPLLLESGYRDTCDEVWCLQVDPARHEELLRSRGWDTDELERRSSRQWSWERKRSASTRVIPNNGTEDDLHRFVESQLDSVLRSE